MKIQGPPLPKSLVWVEQSEVFLRLLVWLLTSSNSKSYLVMITVADIMSDTDGEVTSFPSATSSQEPRQSTCTCREREAPWSFWVMWVKPFLRETNLCP